MDTPAGRALVAATARGVRAVYLGDSTRALVQQLQRDFPGTALRRFPKRLRSWELALRTALQGQPVAVPLDVAGTTFQKEVWEALRSIPAGTRRTYAEVARAVGRPGGARAVARACATNPVPILVPCHRVVRADGSLGGYRWGVRRKQALLDSERTRGGSRVTPPR